VLLLLSAAGCDGGSSGGFKVYNDAPDVSIVAPDDGTLLTEGDPLELRAVVKDPQQSPETLSLIWSSDRDGVLSEEPADSSGNALYATASLSPGVHVITLKALDDRAASGSDTVSLTVEDVGDAPSITIRAPARGDEGVDGEPVRFEALLSDGQDAPEDLLMRVYTDLDSSGPVCEALADEGGVAFCDGLLEAGDHLLTFEVEDLDGGTATAEREFTVSDDNDGDGYSEEGGDCDDENPDVNPGEEEVFNGVDDDCDGVTDNGTVGYDDDGDGVTETDGDCDDADATAFPGNPEVCDGVDNDCDGTVDNGTECYDDDGDGMSETAGDCDDTDVTIYDRAPELADGEDNDCDGTIDEGTTAFDDDGDCFCETAPCAGSVDAACTTLLGDDCDDGDDTLSPGATELCDGVDNDCDRAVDEASAADAATWYRDADTDTYGSASVTTRACTQPTGYVSSNSDCNDGNALINPAAAEVCDSVDNDCDTIVDDGVTTTYYRDFDTDGYGNPSSSTAACSAPSGYVTNNLDCNDADATLSPLTVWYLDSDGDSYGLSTSTVQQCAQPTSYTRTAGDCNDSNSSINPGATERCSTAADDDCDGTANEVNASGCTTYYYDYDGDGYGVSTSQCRCSAGGYYTATLATDCYDYNSAAYPGASSFFYNVSRGDGSYDYNCDGSQTKYYTTTGACTWNVINCTTRTGWNSTNPACGGSASYITSCSWSVVTCSKNTSTYYQYCQ
jgi:hypothetical protein